MQSKHMLPSVGATTGLALNMLFAWKSNEGVANSKITKKHIYFLCLWLERDQSSLVKVNKRFKLFSYWR